MSEYVLTLSCPDRRGIVHAVAGLLASTGASILDSQQFGDTTTGTFFLRIHAVQEEPDLAAGLPAGLAALAGEFEIAYELHDPAVPLRTLVLVSTAGHCLNGLLYRQSSGALPIEVVGVVGNHRDLEPVAGRYDVPFTHLPVDAATRDAQERAILDLVTERGAELVVLARYMQILSAPFCRELAGRVINIHHSFLPSFRGAAPYRQAHERGVKLIGATAHYATADLDEGPIIEQEVARVSHAASPAELARIGRDLEDLALARAVRWHAERRVLLNGVRTVVFS